MYIDIRTFDSSEQVSLDLSRHLPRRTRIGAIGIITERPAIFLSVLKKRWGKIIREVEKQFASTLDSVRKQSLRAELASLKNVKFILGSKNIDPAKAKVIFVSPDDIALLPRCPTLYVHADPSPQCLLLLVSEHLEDHGLLVAYTHHRERYLRLLL